MIQLLFRHVLSETAARRLALAAGFVLLAACAAVVAQAPPEVGAAVRAGLVAAVTLAGVVLGTQLPGLLRGAATPPSPVAR